MPQLAPLRGRERGSTWWIGVAALLATSLVSNLSMLAGPLFMLQVYDRVLASRSDATLLVLVLLIVLVYGFYALIEMLRTRLAVRLANLVERSFGDSLLRGSIRLRLTAQPRSAPDPVRDGDTVRGFLAGPGLLALLDLPWIPVYLALVFLIHPALGWLATAGAVLISLLMLGDEFMLRKPTQSASEAANARQRQAEDNGERAEAILAMGMSPAIGRLWMGRSAALMGFQRIAADRAGLFNASTRAARLLLQSLVLGLGAYLVIHGNMTGGLMIAASVLTSRALAPVEQTVAHWRHLVAARQALARLRAGVGSRPTAPETTLPLPRTELSVRNLSAAPPGLPAPLVSRVQFDLQAGEALGVIGPSGSGKSSLARALCGIWQPGAGEIRLDGALLSHYDETQQGRMIGYLPQRVDLLDGTVAQNIARFIDDASSDEVIAAARLADAHGLILNLPEGYDTRLVAGGENISAGQRQRIGLARALFGDPFLVILDEPNSNLDAEGETALTEAIRSVKARRGLVIVVAHRPSAIVAVDKLLLLRNGRQVAFGSRAEILASLEQGNVHPLPVRAS